MENRELKEYLAEFADGTQVSVIIANPKKRKVYMLFGKLNAAVSIRLKRVFQST